MNKKTVALTLLSLASVFALSTTVVNAEETTPTVDATETTTTTGSDVTINPGSLSVTKVSESLEFGALTIKGDGSGQIAKSTNDLNLTVADLRGTREGWHVTAKHDGVKNSTVGKEDTLEKTTITLNNGDLSNNVDATNAPTLSSANTIIGTDSVLISNSTEGNGMGSWAHSWKTGNVDLNIPAKEARDMYKGQYSTTITWKLVAGPQAE